MNERIKKLAEQASILSRQEHPELEQGVTLNDILGNTERKVYVIDDVTTQKFAELIVLDCAYIADQNFSLRMPTGQFMKKYFGVEE
jgi:hypothetical protein